MENSKTIPACPRCNFRRVIRRDRKVRPIVVWCMCGCAYNLESWARMCENVREYRAKVAL